MKTYTDEQLKRTLATPETDKRIGVISNGSNVVDASWARQLERERDEARTFQGLELAFVTGERDQLRKVCDELAKHDECCHGPGRNLVCGRCNALAAYNSLPHVIAVKKGNEV